MSTFRRMTIVRGYYLAIAIQSDIEAQRKSDWFCMNFVTIGIFIQVALGIPSCIGYAHNACNDILIEPCVSSYLLNLDRINSLSIKIAV